MRSRYVTRNLTQRQKQNTWETTVDFFLVVLVFSHFKLSKGPLNFTPTHFENFFSYSTSVELDPPLEAAFAAELFRGLPLLVKSLVNQYLTWQKNMHWDKFS